MKDIQTFVEVANFVLEIYDENHLNPLCFKFAVITENIIKIISVFYTVVIIVVAAYIGASAVYSDKMTMPTIYPGIAVETIEGNISNAILQILFGAISMGCWMVFDTMVTVVFVNMSMVSQILTEKIVALEDWLREEKLDAKASRQKVLAIISSHIKYNE